MMSTITVKELAAKVDEWHSKRQEVDLAEDVASERNKELDAIGQQLLSMMEELQIDKFEGALGKVRLHVDEYITLPSDEESKSKFIQFLKERGEWDNFATIHHHKLQAWHKAMREEFGDFFMAPGLELPKTRKSIRKSR